MRGALELARRTDWSVYHVTDTALSGGADRVPAVVADAVRGGAGAIQVRDKHASDTRIAHLVRACRTAIANAVGTEAAAHVRLFVNDRVDVAVGEGCHLHIGQDDADPAEARRLLGDDLLLGLSVSTPSHAAAAASAGLADVLGIGPVRATDTKPDAAAPLGVAGVIACMRALESPGGARPAAVAIGGIDTELARALGPTGIDGVCAVSAIAAAPSAADAARTLGEALSSGRDNRRDDHLPESSAPTATTR